MNSLQFTVYNQRSKVEILRECFINRFLRKHSPDTTVRLANVTVRFENLTVTFANLTVGFLRSTVKAVEQGLFTVNRNVLSYETLSDLDFAHQQTHVWQVDSRFRGNDIVEALETF
jgi:hypothetical protein